LGDAEIEDLRGTVAGDENVGWLDVSVDDPRLAGTFQGVTQLCQKFEPRDDVERALVQPIPQGLTVEELHDDVELPLRTDPGVVHVDDVGMLPQAPQDDGLSLAARAHLRSETSWSVGHLDRDITRDEQALGPIDPTVPATPEQLENLVFLEEYVSDAERSACSVGVHEDAPAYPVGEEAEMRAGNTPAPSVNSAAGRRGRDIFLTFRARGCGPHGSRLV